MKNKIKYLPIGILTLTTAYSGILLAGSGASATTSSNATVTVGDSCSFTSEGITTVFSGSAGQTYNTESDTRLATVTCNDPAGFVVKARGKDGNSSLVGSTSGSSIVTGNANPGSTSSWGFKVTSSTGTIESGYGSGYTSVPTNATQIMRYSGSSTAITTGNFRTDYKIYITSSQPADTYTGGVEYTIVTN